MKILVINAGSSSVKAEIVDTVSQAREASFRLKRLGSDEPELQFFGEESIDCPDSEFESCLTYAFEQLVDRLDGKNPDGIGHRVVHGGDHFQDPELITNEVEAAIESLIELAPLHNPANLKGIRIAKKQWPDLPHIAVFDTAFHQSMPRRAQLYGLPNDLTEKHGLKRYGFHGTSHRYVARKSAQYLNLDQQDLRIISCHLGNGASVCAVEYGRSVETSMGLTPLEGLVMGTRSGDVDPGILIKLMKSEGWDADQLDEALNRKSGLVGLAGENHMEELEERAAQGDEQARTAIQVFSHRLRKYIGAYAAIMGGVDIITFTGGIGENSSVIRERVAQRMGFLGAILDEDKNRDADLDAPDAIAEISAPNSRCKLLVVPTDEQYEIALQATEVIEEKFKVKDTQSVIPIAISARHAHLTQETVEILFGKGYQLTEYKPLSQPGQFAANERITLIGPKNKIERVRILGPTRSLNQVEISRTDEFFLGMDAPVRASGNVENSPGITIVGPEGQVTLPEGVICAWRHIHMTPADAAHFGVEDKDIVEVKVENPERSLTFGNVLVRVSPKYKLEMHIDTDEGNAAELGRNATGVLVETGEKAALIKRHR